MQQEKDIDQLSQAEHERVAKFFNDPNLIALLQNQIAELYACQISKQFTFSLTSETGSIYIYLNKVVTLKSDTTDSFHQQSACYAIKITKKFPIEGVRLFLLHNSCQPRIFDCRDLVFELLGDKWTYKNRLIDIINGISRLEGKIASRNQKYLSMQKTGQFQMGDLFTTNELTQFASLDIFLDLGQQQGPLVGTSETHLLTFKQIPQKDKKNSKKIYQLVRACDLQCIHEIHYNQLESEVILTLFKYRSIKSFNEYEKISRKYKLEHPELFLRNILKHITKFQKMQITLQISSSWQKESDFISIGRKIQQCEQLEALIELNPSGKETTFGRLGKNYQKLIEYFSSRASCYYLIYVNKLNNLYSQSAVCLE